MKTSALEVTLLRGSNADVFLYSYIAKFLRALISKNIWERLLLKQLFKRTLVSSSALILLNLGNLLTDCKQYQILS